MAHTSPECQESWKVVNSQTKLLSLPGDRGSLRRGVFGVVLDPLILSKAVAHSNEVGSVLGRFRAPAHGEWPISPACSLDLLPVIDGLNGHLFPRCKAVRGSTIAAKNVAFCSTDGNRTIGWDYLWYGGEGGIRTHGRVSPTLAFEASSFNRSDTSPQLFPHSSGAARAGQRRRIWQLRLHRAPELKASRCGACEMVGMPGRACGIPRSPGRFGLLVPLLPGGLQSKRTATTATEPSKAKVCPQEALRL